MSTTREELQLGCWLLCGEIVADCFFGDLAFQRLSLRLQCDGRPVRAYGFVEDTVESGE